MEYDAIYIITIILIIIYFKKRCGKGTYTYKNGDIYEGDWKENQKHGLGLIKYLNEGEYFGRFENGRRHGEGVFTYKKTNDTYSGFWKYGNKHGEGIYTFNSSKLKLCGDWENGNFIKGKWIFPNGIYWQGEFKKNKPQGIGRWIFPDGNTVEGKFTQLEDEEAEPLPETDEKPIKLNWSTTTKIYNPDAFEDLDINF